MSNVYLGTKQIEAWPEDRTSANGAIQKGMAVKYEDGYISWSPDEAFKAYQASGNLSFGHAVYLLKKGQRVARSGWNGKGMFLYFVPENEDVHYGAYIAIKTAQGNVVPWLASQTDVLADDWSVL